MHIEKSEYKPIAVFKTHLLNLNSARVESQRDSLH